MRISLSADSLASVRFVISPLAHMRVALHPRHPRFLRNGYPNSQDVQAVLCRRSLPLLRALRRSGGSHDFPLADFGLDEFRPDIDRELNRVTDASSTTAAGFMAHAHRLANSAHQVAPDADAPSLQRILLSGEREFAHQLADELSDFWKHCLARHWPSVASRAEEDVEKRGRIAARNGLTMMLDALHPAISCRKHTIDLKTREGVACVNGKVGLYPTALTRDCLVDLNARDAAGGLSITYPATSGDETDEQTPGALSDVLGPSRLILLRSLREPRTTTQLAVRHHMSPSTVSYHLSRLHKAGWLIRTRSGNSVYYRCSEEAERFALSS